MRRTALMIAAAATAALTAASGASAQSYGSYQGGYQNGYQQPYGGQRDDDDRQDGYQNSRPGYGQTYQQPYNNGYQQQPYNNGYQQQPYSQGYQQPYNNGYAPNAYSQQPAYGYQQPQQPYANGSSYNTDPNRSNTGGSLASIFSCDASGGKQATGAVIGGLAGALLGRSLARGNRSLGTGLGAAIGAGAGSYVGCKMQRDDVERATYATNQALTYGSAQTWTNPSTGASGRVNVYADNPRYAQAYGGNDCRIVDQTFSTRSGGSQTERFRACRSGSDWTYTRL